jgi:biotin carboxyl carrier protein
MPRTIRFEWEGKVYEIGMERVGDRLTLMNGEKRYTVTLLPDRSETAAAPPQGSSPAPSAAFPTGTVAPAAAAAPAPAPAQTALGGMPAAGPTAQIDTAGALHAPMTGVVKEIKVAPGHNVEQGQVVLIMEAMKMDIDVPSPASGVVAEVLVKTGDTIAAQQKLMVIH